MLFSLGLTIIRRSLYIVAVFLSYQLLARLNNKSHDMMQVCRGRTDKAYFAVFSLMPSDFN